MSKMIEDRPAWYATAKGGFKGNFTADMKEKVIQNVQRKGEARSMQAYFKRFLATAAGICFLAACFIFFDGSSFSMRSLLHAGGSPVQNNEGIESTFPLEEKSLHYTSEPVYISGTNIPLMDSSDYQFPIVTKSSVKLNTVIDLGGGNHYLTYTKPNEAETNIYQGIELNGYSKEGEIFEWGYGSISEVKLGLSKAFGGDFNRLSGRCGPNLFCTLWLTVDENNVILSHLLSSDGYEVDLDGDGAAEIIATTGKEFNNRVYIIRKRDGITEWVDVDAALNAGGGGSVSYDPNNQVFILSSESGLQYYRYAQGEDKLVVIKE
ncbi:hypothetical protein AB4Z50_15110 [Paenibacillus sp. 2TAB26]|uniref:hypothetical protein n=1 Tax=Paenibacillus sp. 2TAB26 TaxID=3233005 RepID=UPI003F958623